MNLKVHVQFCRRVRGATLWLSLTLPLFEVMRENDQLALFFSQFLSQPHLVQRCCCLTCFTAIALLLSQAIARASPIRLFWTHGVKCSDSYVLSHESNGLSSRQSAQFSSCHSFKLSATRRIHIFKTRVVKSRYPLPSLSNLYRQSTSNSFNFGKRLINFWSRSLSKSSSSSIYLPSL